MVRISDQLGFHQVGPLADARKKVLEAIRTADLAGYLAAWRQYQALVEAHNEPLPTVRKWAGVRTIPAKVRLTRIAVKEAGVAHPYSAWRRYRAAWKASPKDNPYAKAQIGALFAKADIWRETYDRVRYLRELRDAAEYAHRMGYIEFEALANSALDRAARSRSFFAEYCQAVGRFEDAIEEYIEREKDDCLTDRERGLINLRLAECYLAQLEGADESTSTDLRDLLLETISSAMDYLKHEPKQAYAGRLMEVFERWPEYPELLACHGIRSKDGRLAFVYGPSDDNGQPGDAFTVSKADITWIRMPVIRADIPPLVRSLLERPGMALVRCRVVVDHLGSLVVEVPAVSGAYLHIVRPENIARPYRSRTSPNQELGQDLDGRTPR